VKKTILFVDDKETALASYRTLFSTPSAGEWEVSLAHNGAEALAIMSQQPIDIVVTDMRMSGMSGAQLLAQAAQRFPTTIRFILSGYADQEEVARCVGAAHQFLTKPFSRELLLSTVQRVCALGGCLENQQIKELVSSMKTLPSIPAIYFRVLQELQSRTASLETIGNLITTDPAMTAYLLHLVNSAFYGFARHISSPVEAMLMLGLGTVHSLTLSAHAFSCFDQKAHSEFRVEQLWKHSFQTASLAKWIAQLQTMDSTIVEEAFTAGLLHDIGKLMFIANMPAEYRAVIDRVKTRRVSLCEAEEAIFTCTHAEVGAYLLALWGLPVALVEAVALHHQPSTSVGSLFSPLTAVHAANVLAHESEGKHDGSPHAKIDAGYLTRICGSGRLEFWRKNLQHPPAKVAA